MMTIIIFMVFADKRATRTICTIYAYIISFLRLVLTVCWCLFQWAEETGEKTSLCLECDISSTVTDLSAFSLHLLMTASQVWLAPLESIELKLTQEIKQLFKGIITTWGQGVHSICSVVQPHSYIRKDMMILILTLAQRLYLSLEIISLSS